MASDAKDPCGTEISKTSLKLEPPRKCSESLNFFILLYENPGLHIYCYFQEMYFYFRSYLLSMFVVFADYQAYIQSQLMLTLSVVRASPSTCMKYCGFYSLAEF